MTILALPLLAVLGCASPARAAEAAPAKAPAAAPATAAAAPAAAAPAASAAKPEVKTSTTPPPSPSTIYTAEKLRDPFMAGGGGAANASGKPFSIETDFNIHNLQLRGIMKDAAADYALFSDTAFGATFILRKGRLYDMKNKAVPGITGKLKIEQKWASLETPDHDVQIFRLGEDEKE